MVTQHASLCRAKIYFSRPRCHRQEACLHGMSAQHGQLFSRPPSPRRVSRRYPLASPVPMCDLAQRPSLMLKLGRNPSLASNQAAPQGWFESPCPRERTAKNGSWLPLTELLWTPATFRPTKKPRPSDGLQLRRASVHQTIGRLSGSRTTTDPKCIAGLCPLTSQRSLQAPLSGNTKWGLSVPRVFLLTYIL